MSLCAYYLLWVKQGSGARATRWRASTLGNGAQLERINWLADISPQGLQRCAGIMVNYLYRLGDVEDNHESYVREHRVVASRQLSKLARDCPLFYGAGKGQNPGCGEHPVRWCGIDLKNYHRRLKRKLKQNFRSMGPKAATTNSRIRCQY